MTTRYDNTIEPAWCPGCGNFAILKSLKQALAELDLPPERLLICSGIGQAPKLPHYLNCNCFNGLHGREVASATGAKLAATDMTVLVHAGDGGALGEGGNHFISAIRRNIDITLVIHDNHIYGLTKGQASPTTEQGTHQKLQPRGLMVRPMDHLSLAVSQEASFVAQSTAAKPEHLTAMLKLAIEHKGFSLVNVLQPCVTWDKVHTYQYYNDHCRELPAGYDATDRQAAMGVTLNPGDHIPIGLIYTNQRPAYDSLALAQQTAPLRDHPLDPGAAGKLYDLFR